MENPIDEFSTAMVDAATARGFSTAAGYPANFGRATDGMSSMMAAMIATGEDAALQTAKADPSAFDLTRILSRQYGPELSRTIRQRS